MARPEVELQSAARASTPPLRRTRVVLRRLGAWSVFKWSLVFYTAVGLIFLVSAWFLFVAIETSGVLDQVSEQLGGLGLGGACKTDPDSIEQTCHFAIDNAAIFGKLAIWTAVMVVLWSFFNLLVTLLYNLVADIIGGIEMTLVDRR